MEAQFLLTFLFGLLGVAYFVYGRKESEFWFMIAGGGLCLFPLLVSGTVALLIVGVVLLAVPFVAVRLSE